MRATSEILKKAKQLSLAGRLTEEQKNSALLTMADSLWRNRERILSANREDVRAAEGRISTAMIDRLRLDEKRISAMAEGMRAVAALSDPVGKILSEQTRSDGLVIQKVAVPFGVVAIIYESRPNVTSDAAALCFKSGNVCVLRSGRDAIQSAKAIVRALRSALQYCGLPEDSINLVEDTDRKSANELMTAVGEVDLLIPRGGKGLISACVQHATVPVIETGTGICHIYIDKAADLPKALAVVDNAKTSRPSVCNAAEVCLVHRDIAGEFLPMLAQKFKNRCEIRGDKEVCALIGAIPAGEQDFDTEFLDDIMAVGVVADVQEAAEHIARHSTHHSDCILTEDPETADYFLSHVDSAAVYVNASTRFTDGGEFGLGCEMGISTQKLHARGPMGISELTTYQYIVRGNGQIR